MASPSWLPALKEACYHAHDPALHYDSAGEIVYCMLWRWEDYPTPISPRWERPANLMHKYDHYSVEEVFALLQRATVEGNEYGRAFALILLGGLATPQALDIVRSFLTSPSLLERWASAITLGRHKEERAFSLLQTFLLDGFLVNPSTTNEQDAANEEKIANGQIASQNSYPSVDDSAASIEYEWFMHQRWECVLVLGAWGNPCVVPLLIEALQAAWKMEQMWPDYGGFQDGPEIWHAFQDHLAFALGQLGAWHALLDLDLPEKRLIIATIYLALGALQILDKSIFCFDGAIDLFSFPVYIHNLSQLQNLSRLQTSQLSNLPQENLERIKLAQEKYKDLMEGFFARPYVEPARVKHLLARHLGFSEIEQEQYLQRFPEVLQERYFESHPVSSSQWDEQSDAFDPFLDSDD